MRDIRFGLRSLLKRPGSTLVALVTLALGIGVNTAIFSAVDSILLRPLPFEEPERLVSIWEQGLKLGIKQNAVAPANFFDLRKQSQAFEDIGAYGPQDINLTGGDAEPERLNGELVTANVFSILGIEPVLGRTFSPDEDTAGKHRVVVLSERLWQRRFNRSRSGAAHEGRSGFSRRRRASGGLVGRQGPAYFTRSHDGPGVCRGDFAGAFSGAAAWFVCGAGAGARVYRALRSDLLRGGATDA